MAIHISSAFDSGNIRVLEQPSERHFRLSIAKDADDNFFQWFHFRLSGARGQAVTLDIVGLNESAYPLGWPGYRARASVDRENWFQLDTGFDSRADGGRLRIEVTPTSDLMWIAYFAPYSMERHQDLIARTSLCDGVSSRVLGYSLDGQPIDCIEMGEGPAECWIFARQHPGEAMAEWWMEGALAELTDLQSPVARLLRSKARLHIIPNMNPDGSRRGYLRTNAAGANLNREWGNPTPERAPEVLAARNAMDETGVDFAFDVHGDEALPHNFIAGFEGIPSITERQMGLLGAFKDRLAIHSPEFQTAKGYPVSAPGTANLSMSTNHLADRFGCLSATLEMPFKDADDLPQPLTGWSPERSRRLAVACLTALADIVDDLRP